MTTLTTSERQRFQELEGTIEAGVKHFLNTGNALVEIRDGKLYRDSDATFEAYCKRRWDISGRYAYQLIEASSVVKNLRAIAHKNTPSLPENEYQARHLAKVEPERQAEAWQAAVESAPKSPDGTPKVTAAHVKATVEKFLPDPPAPKPKPTPKPEPEPEPDTSRGSEAEMASAHVAIAEPEADSSPCEPSCDESAPAVDKENGMIKSKLDSHGIPEWMNGGENCEPLDERPLLKLGRPMRYKPDFVERPLLEDEYPDGLTAQERLLYDAIYDLETLTLRIGVLPVSLRSAVNHLRKAVKAFVPTVGGK